MAVGAFPIAKLAALAMRQLSKPLANRLKLRAKSSPFFRRYVCMPPAQFYHWCEVNVKMRLLNLGKPSAVKPLKEVEAIELGAELLGECIIFTIASATIIAEYIRQSRNERLREDMKEDRLHRLTHDMEDLQIVVSRQEAELRHLSRVLGARHTQMARAVPTNPSAKKDAGTYASLECAIEDAQKMLGKDKQAPSESSSEKAPPAEESVEKKNAK